MLKSNFRLFLSFCVFGLSACSTVFALDTRAIDEIRRKAVLDSADQKAVAVFVNNAVEEFFYVEDFTSVSTLRLTIASRSSSINETSAQQYKAAFNSAAKEKFKAALDKARAIADKNRAGRIQVNLLLLLSDFTDSEFAEIAIENIDSDSAAIRYAAIKCVVNPEVIKQLNSGGSQSAMLIKDLVAKMSKSAMVETDGSVLAEIIGFAGSVNGTDTAEMILKITNDRIDKYARWEITNEYVDQKLLDAIYSKASKTLSDQMKNDLMAGFAQLYSYVIQRYALAGDDLTDTRKGQLVDVIVGIESETASKILGSKVGSLKKAIERNDMDALMAAHDSMLGSDSGKGMLASAIDFYYQIDGENKVYQPKKLTLPITKEQ